MKVLASLADGWQHGVASEPAGHALTTPGSGHGSRLPATRRIRPGSILGESVARLIELNRQFAHILVAQRRVAFLDQEAAGSSNQSAFRISFYLSCHCWRCLRNAFGVQRQDVVLGQGLLGLDCRRLDKTHSKLAGDEPFVPGSHSRAGMGDDIIRAHRFRDLIKVSRQLAVVPKAPVVLNADYAGLCENTRARSRRCVIVLPS